MFGTMCAIAPRTAANLACNLISKPPRMKAQAWQLQLKVAARQSWLRVGSRGVAMYSWGRGPTVLMVHDWGTDSTHMGKMIGPLVDAGFRVVSFDAPAHGQSEGRHTDMVEFAAAIDLVAKQAGPIHTIIAHSFGAAMTLFARRDWGVEAERQIFIGTFDHCKWFTEVFSQLMGITDEVMEIARQIVVERHNGRLDWDRLSIVELFRRAREPTLLIHDRDDIEIPFKHTVALNEVAFRSELLITAGLGHHRILSSLDVIERVVNFVSKADPLVTKPENSAEVDVNIYEPAVALDRV